MSIDSTYKAGLKALAKAKVDGKEAPTLYAIAAMIAHKPRKVGKGPTLKVSPQFVYTALREKCDGLALATTRSTDFSRLGRTMQSISPPVEEKDVDKLVDWFNNGGVSYWSTPVTWSHVVKHFVTWLASARSQEVSEQEWESPIR